MRGVFLLSSFLKNMYIYLHVPGLFIDMCVEFITGSKGKQSVYPKHSLTALLISNFDMTGSPLSLHMHHLQDSQIHQISISKVFPPLGGSEPAFPADALRQRFPNPSRYPPHCSSPPNRL